MFTVLGSDVEQFEHGDDPCLLAVRFLETPNHHDCVRWPDTNDTGGRLQERPQKVWWRDAGPT